uniref:hypothetical protein n=1 Tax=Streptomyces sp. NBC_01562 TaxID=2975879 RepID=UPI002F90EF9C
MAKRPLFHFPSRQASIAPASQNATYHLAIVTPDIANAQTQHQHEHDQGRTATQPRAA